MDPAQLPEMWDNDTMKLVTSLTEYTNGSLARPLPRSTERFSQYEQAIGGQSSMSFM